MGGIPSLTSNCFCQGKDDQYDNRVNNIEKSYEIIKDQLRDITNEIRNKDLLVKQNINNIENKLILIYDKFTRIEDKLVSKFDLLLMQIQQNNRKN
jgi:hypothetical protein